MKISRYRGGISIGQSFVFIAVFILIFGNFIFIYCSMKNSSNNQGRRRGKKASFMQFTEDDAIDDFSPSKYADERIPAHMRNSNSNDNRPRSSPPSGRGNRDEREAISQRGFNNFVLNNNNNNNSKTSLEM